LAFSIPCMPTFWVLSSALGACAEVKAPACTVADGAALLDDPGGFYRCADGYVNGRKGCGEQGYPLGYGLKYAERFMWEIYPDVSEAGQVFLSRNLVCLQTAFKDGVDGAMSCDEVSKAGFAAHPGCYLDSGICDLPFADKAPIFLAVDAQDLAHPAQAGAIERIIEACAAGD